MVVGRVFRGIGNIAGRIHGTVFRALGRLPLVGGVFKTIGQLSAGAIGMLGSFTPMAMLGLGEYSPTSSFMQGFSQGSLSEQMPMQTMGSGFSNMYGAPSCGYNMGGPQFGSPFSGYGPQYGCCCSCGYQGF